MRATSQRGFTLVELIIAVAVTAVALAGAVVVLRTQQQAFHGGQHLRTAQGNARSALMIIEEALGQAGYGMDPALAFDFGRYSGPCPPEMIDSGKCPRDATGNSDELVFHSRNPRYSVPTDPSADPSGNAWRATGLDETSITLEARGGETFVKGQILQLVCRGGDQFLYATVSTTKTLDAGAQAVLLEAVASTNPFQRQDAILGTSDCITAGTARVFLIDRYRLHVRPVGSVPYLVLDRGVDLDRSGTIDAGDEQIVAEGIETLQVAYVFANPALPVAGASSGVPITFAGDATTVAPFGENTKPQQITKLPFPGPSPTGNQTVYDPTSWYSYQTGPPPSPVRYNDSQANIRLVRVAVVARSPEANRDHFELFPLPVLNQNAAPAWISVIDKAAASRGEGYARVRFDTSVPLSNMTLRGMTYF